jgi:hypothetical protein
MKRQTRPFIVEVKQKRGNPKQTRSIWGDLDLSVVIDETTREAEKMNLPKRPLVDSRAAPIDVDDGIKSQPEHLMADPQEAEPEQIVVGTSTIAEAPEVKKKAPRPKTAKAPPERSARETTSSAIAANSSATVRKPRKIHSATERTQKLGQIEKSIGRGESVKVAANQAGISEQTYYQWKKSAAPAPVSESGDLKDLIALEEENAHLKKLLAQHLRKENAELKKKLGLN